MIILVLKIIFLNVTFLLRFSVYCKLIYKQFDNIINLSIFTEQEYKTQYFQDIVHKIKPASVGLSWNIRRKSQKARKN